MNIVLLGPPGCGKGTLGEQLEIKLNLERIATGDLIRAEIEDKTEFGLHAQEMINKGFLIADEKIVDIVVQELKRPKYQSGAIFDGFPRTIKQAQLMEEKGIHLDHVISLEAPEELLIQRLSSRRICKKCTAVFNVLTNPPKKEGICDKCGEALIQRDDDHPEVIKKRLDVYREKTAELIGYYKEHSAFKTVDGSLPPEEVVENTLAAIKS
ncbi:MAG: adenylate kinase [Candidatus Nanoarchaeia archaeon]